MNVIPPIATANPTIAMGSMPVKAELVRKPIVNKAIPEDAAMTAFRFWVLMISRIFMALI
jgi:hypothetical protein